MSWLGTWRGEDGPGGRRTGTNRHGGRGRDRPGTVRLGGDWQGGRGMARAGRYGTDGPEAKRTGEARTGEGGRAVEARTGETGECGGDRRGGAVGGSHGWRGLAGPAEDGEDWRGGAVTAGTASKRRGQDGEVGSGEGPALSVTARRGMARRGEIGPDGETGKAVLAGHEPHGLGVHRHGGPGAKRMAWIGRRDRRGRAGDGQGRRGRAVVVRTGET